jgi:hypothetical protein
MEKYFNKNTNVTEVKTTKRIVKRYGKGKKSGCDYVIQLEKYLVENLERLF